MILCRLTITPASASSISWMLYEQSGTLGGATVAGEYQGWRDGRRSQVSLPSGSAWRLETGTVAIVPPVTGAHFWRVGGSAGAGQTGPWVVIMPGQSLIGYMSTVNTSCYFGGECYYRPDPLPDELDV
jgi:hypothetical protein